jgi:hypothetical protein
MIIGCEKKVTDSDFTCSPCTSLTAVPLSRQPICKEFRSLRLAQDLEEGVVDADPRGVWYAMVVIAVGLAPGCSS